MAKKNQNRPGSPAFWRQHNLAWERSSLSQREYCRRHGLKLSTFGYWRRRQTQSSQPAAQATEFVKISAATGAPRSSGLELVIGDEVIVRIGNHLDPELLIEVVRAVRRAI